MGQRTTIEWTDATWNPIRGCSRVSEGCRNCYGMSFRDHRAAKTLRVLRAHERKAVRWRGGAR